MRLTSLDGGSMYIGGMPRYTGKTSVSSNGNMSTGMIHKGREIHKVDHDLQGKQSIMINFHRP